MEERRGPLRSSGSFARRWPPGPSDRSVRSTLTAGLILLALLAQSCHLATLDQARRRAHRLSQTSFLYAADGSLITAFHGEENRVVVPYTEIPKVVRQAVIAIEDQRFYQHKGVDLKALLRAAYVDATEGHVVQGGSTITEQYVKNRFLGPEQTLSRKIKEAALAWQLEQHLSKRQILTRYLNTVYFGQGAYGIQAAAKTYFSEPASALDLPQAATIAGLIAAPSAYNPIEHPGMAMFRRDLVLRMMRHLHMISRPWFRRARHSPLRVIPSEPGARYPAPYFVDFVKRWFVSNPRFGSTRSEREDLLYRGGLHIYTTLVPRLQKSAEEAIRQILIFKRDPYAAMTVIDPRTGRIKAMVGGRNFFSPTDPVAQVNLATGGITGRQAGSSFKPFALVAALEAGISPNRVYAAPASIVLPLPPDCQAPNEPVWSVQNYDGTAQGYLTVDQATVDSVNVVYAQIVRDLGNGDPCAGAKKVVAVAKRLGVNAPELMNMGVGETLKAVPSSVLGAEQVNTVEMALSYSTLANMGYRVSPIAVSKITSAHGKVIYDAQPERSLVMDPPVAWIADQILENVVRRGTGFAADIGRPTIGKTGTAQQWRDAWFVGAIPQLSAAVWVGFPTSEISMVAPRVRLPHVLGGTWPAQIWHTFMVNATRDVPVRDFPRPVVRYVTVVIDQSRDCLPNQFTPPYLLQRVRYLAGTQPRAICTEPRAYQPLPVPSVIGLTELEATSVLHNAGFNVSSVNKPSDLPAGLIIEQSPPPGEQALQASTVTISVAVPKPTPVPGPSASGASPSPTGTSPLPTPTGSPGVAVPDVKGMSQHNAVSALQAGGFGVAVIQKGRCHNRRKGCHQAPGLVWRERPHPGEIAKAGSTVTIWVNP